MALPTHADFLATLPRVSHPEDDKCDICSEAFADLPASSRGGELSGETLHATVMAPCSHVFGEACLLEWLKEQTTCPMCRRVLCEAEDDDWVTEGGWRTDDEASDSEDEVVFIDDEMPDYEDTEEDLQIRESLEELSISVLPDDSSNRETILVFFDDMAEIADGMADLVLEDRLEYVNRSISVTNHARLSLWRHGELVVNNADFRNVSVGAVSKGSVSPRLDHQDFVVDAEAINERVMWYFRAVLETAATDLNQANGGRQSLGLALHPATLRLVEATTEMLRGTDGVQYSPEQVKRELRDWLDAQLTDDAPWGFEFVIWDLMEIAALALCGMPVKMYMKRGFTQWGVEGWETFGGRERSA